MLRIGTFLTITAIILWGLSYFSIFIFENGFWMFIFAGTLGIIGGILIFISVFKERLRENEEDKKIDYSDY